MKRVSLALLATTLILAGCSNSGGQLVSLPLTPVPYLMKVDRTIATHLSVEAATGDWAKQASKDGALNQAIVYYTPASGSRVIFMSVYEFPAKQFDSLQNPNQPPPYGQEVIRKNGKVFSIAGPQDSIFDPKTQDGKNISALYATITKASTYSTAP